MCSCARKWTSHQMNRGGGSCVMELASSTYSTHTSVFLRRPSLDPPSACFLLEKEGGRGVGGCFESQKPKPARLSPSRLFFEAAGAKRHLSGIGKIGGRREGRGGGRGGRPILSRPLLRCINTAKGLLPLPSSSSLS